MDSDMYEAQIEENKTMMQKVQAEEDQRKELQNKVVRLDQIVDILVKLKSELEAREKYAAELRKAEATLQEVSTDVASAMHINESYDHSMKNVGELERLNEEKRRHLKDLKKKIDNFDPLAL